MPLRPRLAILLLLAPLVTFAAEEPGDRTFPYAHDWVDALAFERSVTALDWAFASGSHSALPDLVQTLAADPKAFRSLADLDDSVRARLVADLVRYDRTLIPILDDADHMAVLKLAEFFGVRRPEAVPLLLRAVARDNQASQTHERIHRLADEAFTHLDEAPGVLRALADAAATGDPEVSAAALNHLPNGDAGVRAALASAIARAAALGQFGAAAHSLLDDKYVDFRTLVRAFTVALNSSFTATQRLRVLAAIGQADLLPRLAPDDPLVTTIVALSGQAGAPGGQDGARRLISAAVVAINVEDGLAPAAEVLAPLKSDPASLRDVLAPALSSSDKSTRLAAIQTVQMLGKDGVADYKQRLTTLLASPDHDTRFLAAQSLGDERSLAVARVYDILADCRADSPTLRETAARQLHGLNLFPEVVTAGLLRAVAARDMAAREGFLRAIERAYAVTGADPLLALQSAAADPDPATRAYARAALRGLDTAKDTRGPTPPIKKGPP